MRTAMRTAGRSPRGIPGSVIRWGSLGRPAGAKAEAPRDVRRGAAELAAWDLRHGRAWCRALEAVARRAARAGIPVRAGSAGLFGSATLEAWGWCGPVSVAWRRAGAEERWVLRVPPGAGAVVRGWLDEDAAPADMSGAPSVLIEETSLAFLPAAPAGAWPSAESWLHAQQLLGVAGSFHPRSAQELLTLLREGDAAAGRRPVADDRAALLAWDLLCAAWAWERDPASFWLASLPAGGPARRLRAAWRNAEDRGLRILAPCVQRSMLCARPEPESPGAVRLGLDHLGPDVAAAAPALLAERTRGGVFRSVPDLVLRARRAGVSWRALAALLVAGCADALPWRADSRAVAGAARAFVVSFPGTERRAACRLSCLTP